MFAEGNFLLKFTQNFISIKVKYGKFILAKLYYGLHLFQQCVCISASNGLYWHFTSTNYQWNLISLERMKYY